MSAADGRHTRSHGSARGSGFDPRRTLNGSEVTVRRSEVVAAYDSMHARGAVNALPGYYEWLLGLVWTDGPGRLADIGCGTGEMLAAASSAGLCAFGVDVSPVAVRIARARAPRSTVQVAAAEELPFDSDTFDLVTCCGSLEHFHDPGRAVMEMARVARPGAPILVVVPNSHYLFAWVTHLRVGVLPQQSQPIERFATLPQWTGFLTQHGLRVDAVHKDNRFYFSLPLMRLLAEGVARVTPRAVSYQFALECRSDTA